MYYESSDILVLEIFISSLINLSWRPGLLYLLSYVVECCRFVDKRTYVHICNVFLEGYKLIK